jgi:hypothetical protein
VFDHLIEKLTGTVVQEAEKTRLTLEAGFSSSLRGTRLSGALPRPVQPNASAYTAGGRLVGWSIRATGGEVVLNLYDGPAADPARFVAAVDLPTGGSQSQWMGPGGISFVEGLYVESTGAGTPIGALWIGAVD